MFIKDESGNLVIKVYNHRGEFIGNAPSMGRVRKLHLKHLPKDLHIKYKGANSQGKPILGE